MGRTKFYEDKESLEILEAIHKGASTVDRVVETIIRKRTNEEYEKLEGNLLLSSLLLCLVFIIIFSIAIVSIF